MKCVALVSFLIVFAAAASGDAISFTISNPAQNTTIGGTAIFSGTLTNNSGTDLDATEFFVNAFAFDPTVLSIQQLLGMPDVFIPNGTTSATLDLFSISVATTAQQNTSYQASVFVEDVNSDQTSSLNASIQTSPVSTVPEPRTAPVLGLCLLALLWRFLRTRRKSRVRPPPVEQISLRRAVALTLRSAIVAIVCSAPSFGQSPMFSTGTPAVTLTDPTDLTIAMPLVNSGSGAATGIQVTKATLNGATLTTGPLPLNVGALSPLASSIVTLSFSSATFNPGSKSLFTISGSYSSGLGFTVNRFVTIPPPGVVQPQPPASCRCTTNCINLQITSPTSGSMVNASTVAVSGTVVDSADEVGVVINGFPALVQNGQFQAANIPLSFGINTITASASDSCLHQTTATAQVNVITLTPPSVKVIASPTSGVAPFTVSLTAAVSSPNPIMNYQWDFDGNGTVDSSGPALSTVSTTYSTPGLFTAKVVAIDSQGQQFAGSLPVLVLSFTALNGLLQNRWNGLTSALAGQNIPTALSFFHPGFAPQFSSVLTALGSQLPSVGSSLSSANLLSVSGGVAEMVTIRTQQGSTHAYFIYFMQDENGFWKIVGL
jgi:PKD repeat protein